MNNELIEAAKAVIARWDSTDWKAAPTAEVMNRLRNALSTKEPAKLPEIAEFLESKCTTIDNLDDSTWVIEVDHVGEFLNRLTAAHAAELAAIEHERSGVEGAMYARILALEAELAKYKALEDAVDHELVISLDATLDGYPSAKEAVKDLLDWHSEVAIDPRVSSAARALIEQGRREALAYDPPIPNEIKGRVQAEWFWKGVLAMREQEETK